MESDPIVRTLSSTNRATVPRPPRRKVRRACFVFHKWGFVYCKVFPSSTAKLYGLKIYINNVIVRDYIPGIKNGVAGTVCIDMTDIDLKGRTSRFPLFKTGSAGILPSAGAVMFVGGRPPAGWSLSKAKPGFGYDLAAPGFSILLR